MAYFRDATPSRRGPRFAWGMSVPAHGSVLTEPASDLDPIALTSSLQRTFAAPSYRPPTLPGVALEVMQLATRPEVQFSDLVQVLEYAPVLAARVLSIAQSAKYAGRSPVLSLRQGAIRIGLATLREIVMEAALHLKIFRVPGHEDLMARLYRHSTAVAH